MIRKGLLVSALAAGALIGSTPAQASVSLAATSGLINLLHNNSTFTANNFQFSICQNGNCQVLFTGIAGLRNMGGLGPLNSWANIGSFGGTPGFFDNYQFTYTATGSYFGNSNTGDNGQPEPQQQRVAPPTMPIPEPATWAMMIVGFGAIGFAMRRRAMAVSFG